MISGHRGIQLANRDSGWLAGFGGSVPVPSGGALDGGVAGVLAARGSGSFAAGLAGEVGVVVVDEGSTLFSPAALRASSSIKLAYR